MTPSNESRERALAEEFDVTVEQIRDAVRVVGEGKGDIELYLKGSRSSTDSDVTREGLA